MAGGEGGSLKFPWEFLPFKRKRSFFEKSLCAERSLD
jgi:hypothetical protein